MTAHKPSRLALALPVILFLVSLLSLRLYTAAGITVAALAGAAALALVARVIYTQSRSIDDRCEHQGPVG